MKKIIQRTIVFTLLVFVASCSCERYEEAKNAVNAVKNLAENAENIQESMEDANDRMEERKKRGDTIAIHYEQLAEYLPESFDGYEKEGEMDGGTTKTPGLGSYSNVGQRYLNADGDKVEINIMDYNTAYAIYTTTMAAYASGFEIDNTNEQIKGFEYSDDVKGWTMLQKKDHVAEAYAGVSDRFHITVHADNQESIDFVMDVATKEIPIDRLAKL
jgi:hypothetical protein